MRHLVIIKMWFITITAGDIAKALRIRAKFTDVKSDQVRRLHEAATLLDGGD